MYSAEKGLELDGCLEYNISLSGCCYGDGASSNKGVNGTQRYTCMQRTVAKT